MQIDMSLEELQVYKPALIRQPDFMEFWQKTLALSNSQPLRLEMTFYPYTVERVRVYNISFDGLNATSRVHGWYLEPTDPWLLDSEGHIPTIVFYHGYGATRNVPGVYLHWVLQGFAVLGIDTRGQNGVTPDHQPYPQGSANGWLTRGLSSPYEYYYRFVYMDCVRALDVVRSLPQTGALFVTGPSQGGGLALAAAALGADRGLAGAMVDVPFLCHFRRAVEVSTTTPYSELAGYWKQFPHRVEQDFQTLSYFDCMNLAPMITCPVLFSIGLMDDICPPSTTFAVYNHLQTEKELKAYPFNGHEGGGAYQQEEQYRFIRQYLPAYQQNSSSNTTNNAAKSVQYVQLH